MQGRGSEKLRGGEALCSSSHTAGKCYAGKTVHANVKKSSVECRKAKEGFVMACEQEGCKTFEGGHQGCPAQSDEVGKSFRKTCLARQK